MAAVLLMCYNTLSALDSPLWAVLAWMINNIRLAVNGRAGWLDNLYRPSCAATARAPSGYHIFRKLKRRSSRQIAFIGRYAIFRLRR